MAIDLKSLQRKELVVLKQDIDKALRDAEVRERRDALKAAENAAAEYGFSLEELLSDKMGRGAGKAPKSAPKYRNPENPDQTWSGRGRKPKWVHDAIANGADLSSLKI
ncbi:H-NS histone family protein [Rhodobacteraceae bacterium F11138]|nr:H-NS histone family protein [Rhodobacteraceae bacterium F11138]